MNTPEIGARINIMTQPFVDSDKTCEREVTFLGSDSLHFITERKPGSRHYVPTNTIIAWENI